MFGMLEWMEQEQDVIRARLREKFADVISQVEEEKRRDSLSLLPPKPRPRVFSYERYARLVGCHRPEELRTYGLVDGAPIADVYQHLVDNEEHVPEAPHFLESVLTTAECDTVAGILLAEIVEWIPDRQPNHHYGDHPPYSARIEKLAAYAWERWGESAYRTWNVDAANGVPEHERICVPRSRQAALGGLYTDVCTVCMQVVERRAGVTRVEDYQPTRIGYDEWERLRVMYLKTILNLLGIPTGGIGR